MALNNLNGQLIELWRVADIRLENVSQILQRINQQSSITVTANASGRPSGDVISDIKTQIAKTPFPKGTQFIYLFRRCKESRRCVQQPWFSNAYWDRFGLYGNGKSL
ncbi:MAG: hypothetical protein DI598_17950 [Pseudopedobacter saltans]|uniref:Uncharacterized protein n=1 Tax=Pseudopedobacter saltans TaxID=151895 RepID=A0A2W5G842_9SPHI|nr:MAG: hypothetical protein DI598_17950 [Pseudopedobacter saltans]